MKLEELSRDGEEIQFRVSVSADEMSNAFTDGLDAFVLQYNLGQLEGDTSLDKLLNAFEKDEAQQAIYSAVINYLVPFAISEFGEAPLATYGIESEDAPESGKPFAFTMMMLVRPEYRLSSYEPAKVEIEAKPEVQDEDLEEQMRMLARQMAAAQQNVDASSSDLVTPEVTDDWVKENLADMNISTVAELRERFRQTSEEELATRYEQAKMAAAMEEYASRFDGHVSEKMLSAMTQELYETFLAELASEGMDFKTFSVQQNLTEDDVRATLSAQAENQLIQGFILDAIFEHEELKLEATDLARALRNMAPGREEDTFEAIQKSGREFLLKQGASRMKAAEWIMENTTFITK